MRTNVIGALRQVVDQSRAVGGIQDAMIQTMHELLALPYYHPSIEEILQSALKSAAQQLRS